jgi:hypothetical protein
MKVLFKLHVVVPSGVASAAAESDTSFQQNVVTVGPRLHIDDAAQFLLRPTLGTFSTI